MLLISCLSTSGVMTATRPPSQLQMPMAWAESIRSPVSPCSLTSILIGRGDVIDERLNLLQAGLGGVLGPSDSDIHGVSTLRQNDIDSDSHKLTVALTFMGSPHCRKMKQLRYTATNSIRSHDGLIRLSGCNSNRRIAS